MTASRPSPAGEPGDTRAPAGQRPDAAGPRPDGAGRRPTTTTRGRGDRSIAYGVVAAVVGAAVLFVLAGPLSVDTGLLVVGVAVGWVVGVAVRTGAARARLPRGGPGARVGLAVTLALAACAVAWAGTWGWSHVQGGVLGPVDFVSQVYGLLLPAQLVFAAAAAAIGSR